MLGSEAGSEQPILALDVVNDRRAGPGQERGDDETDALAAPGRGEAENMLRSIVAEIAALMTTQHDAIGSEQAGLFDLLRLCPSRGTIGLDVLRLAGAPDGHGDRNARGDDPARSRDIRPLVEDRRRVGVIGIPPPEKGRRRVKREMQNLEPGASEFRLKSEAPCRPLGRGPDRQQDDGEDGDDLTPENFGCGHCSRPFVLGGIAHNPSPRLRPKLQSTPPSPRATPETWRPSCFSRDGVQGTSWKPRPSSIMAKRPEASAKRCR